MTFSLQSNVSSQNRKLLSHLFSNGIRLVSGIDYTQNLYFRIGLKIETIGLVHQFVMDSALSFPLELRSEARARADPKFGPGRA